MERSTTPLKSLIFDLYLHPSLLVVGLYQIILTAVFTGQQLLLAAYLDELGFILISGIMVYLSIPLQFVRSRMKDILI